MDALWRDDDLAQRFAALTALLQQNQQFWRHHAFKYLELPWEREFPELAQQLRRLSYADAEQLARDDRATTDFLRRYVPVLTALASACAIGYFDIEPLPIVPEPRDIPGRKWQQIRYFAPCVPENNFAALEWCSGKAHLGRVLAKRWTKKIIALERDARLIAAGKILATREQTEIDFQCVDVMTDAAADMLQKNHHAVALHACGDLHVRLLQLCARKHTQTISLAPCCYQLVADSQYVLSGAARASGLQLRHDDLRTAVHGTVTSSLRLNRQRYQLQAWRLGFDLLQRELRNIDAYFTTPAMSTTILQTSFVDFCLKVAAHHHWQLPDGIDYLHFEHAGNERLRVVTALDLPRIAHRRALELWIALDRALFLREQGYAVAMGQFCKRTLTPRNILISAEYLAG